MTINRKKQVKTTKEVHGERFYKEIGSVGGNNSPTKFDSTSGSKAANARWDKYRADQLNKEKGDIDGRPIQSIRNN
jgi:hypothetical protein